jgi:hypothetical protein
MQLPYDRTCPVIHDNDTVIDVYTEDYLMALASAGDIRLEGLITSSSIQPYNIYVPEYDFESDLPISPTRLNFVKNRAHGVKLARASGFQNIPDPIIGIKGHLEKPVSGRIEDTQPHNSPGTRLIIEHARQATQDKPLVLVMGGTLSVAADAYLLDPTVADRMVIAWLGGDVDSMGDYNGAADWWSAFIVAQRLRLVQFPNGQAMPLVPRSRLVELPDRPLRQWLIEKRHPRQVAHEYDGDGQPAVALMRPDYVLEMKRKSFSHWGMNTGTAVPTEPIPYFKDDDEGNIWVVTRADQSVGTEEWWRAMKNPTAWHDLNAS